MDRFYLYDFNEPKFSQEIERYNQLRQSNKTQLVVMLDKWAVLSEEFPKDINQFMSMLGAKGIGPHDVAITIGGNESHFSSDEWVKVKQIRDKLQTKGISFGIEDYKNVWSLEEVENANAQIKSSADKLRGKNFSPLEKLLSAYLDVTKRNYNSETQTEHVGQSRSIYGVLNSDKIVCVGFAALLKSVMEEVGDENIKVYYNSVACSDDNVHLSAYHRNLIIYIKDEKYGLDGYYYVDPTWDCSNSNKSEFKLNHFLLPLKDIPHIKTHIRDFNIKLERAPQDKPAKKTTQKERKAIAKNKQRTYNRIQEGNSSFSSDNFVFSSQLQDHIIHNEPVADRLDEYLGVGNELIKDLINSPYRFVMDEVKNYFLENNIHYLSYSVGDKLEKMIKENASVEECIDYADSVVKKLRFGKTNLTKEEYKKEFLVDLRNNLQKAFNMDSEKDFLNTIKSIGERSQNSKGLEYINKLEEKIANIEQKIDAIIDIISKIYDENPDLLIRLNDKSKLDQEDFDYNFLARRLSSVEIADKQSVIDALNAAEKVVYDVHIDRMFNNINRTIIEQETQKGNDLASEKSEIKSQMIYAALCDSSNPLTINQLSRALYTVITKRNPKITPAKAQEVVNNIMDYNTRRSRHMFTEGAVNPFSTAYAETQSQKGAQDVQK